MFTQQQERINTMENRQLIWEVLDYTAGMSHFTEPVSFHLKEQIVSAIDKGYNVALDFAGVDKNQLQLLKLFITLFEINNGYVDCVKIINLRDEDVSGREFTFREAYNIVREELKNNQQIN